MFGKGFLLLAQRYGLIPCFPPERYWASHGVYVLLNDFFFGDEFYRGAVEIIELFVLLSMKIIKESSDTWIA